MCEYPTEAQLSEIEHWDFLESGITPLLEKIGEAWHYREWGFRLTGKKTLRLELHTGGWSGNESVIEVLEKNLMFYACFWQKSLRGGHYYFKIAPSFIKHKRAGELVSIGRGK